MHLVHWTLIAAVTIASAGCDGQSSKGSSTDAAGAAPSASIAAKPGDVPAPPDVAAPPADAVKTASGLAFKILQPGKGAARPEPQDAVRVNYTGWTTDGKMFDSSTTRKEPARFSLKGIIPGWSEALGLMVEGEKRRLWIPEDLAYKGRVGPPKGMLVFDVELVEIIAGPKPIPAPPDVAEPPKDAVKTKSGLVSKVIEKGTGVKRPGKEDTVKVNYTGWTTDGKMFDSSLIRKQPAVLQLGSAIPGWSEGLQLMVVGEKRRLWIPENLIANTGPGGPRGTLVFDMELVEIVVSPKAPADVAAPPAAAKKTASGLATKVLQPGTGKDHPTATSTVQVHYTGWTTDGKMFDSSVTRGQPATFPLNGVIAGWTEGLQLMVAGEKRRLWIPEALAYKGAAGKPKGMLVFDVELLEIKK